MEIIGEFVQLKKRGGNHFGLSPFVNEKTPSFAVSASKNIWKDFSTGKGGNAIGFLMDREGMTYPEALKYCAEKYSIEIEYEGDNEPQAPDNRGTLLAISSHAASLFHSQLVAGSAALKYLQDRGVSPESIEDFQIGFAPDQWEWMAAKLSNYPKEAIKLSGLCFENETGKLTDRFRNRIMFPITDHFGKVIAFGGRVFGDGKGAKYINSPESEIYHKSKVLYGLHKACKAIRDADCAILTEGYLDVITLHQCGHTNAIASCGTALTKEQCQLIRRFTLNVLIVRDSDKAGLTAMVRDVRMLLSQGMYPSLLPLPEKEDPDSFCRKVGGQGFAEHKAKHTRNFVDFLIRMGKSAHDANEPQGRAAIINEVMEVLAVIQDPVLLVTSQQRLSQVMVVPMAVIAGNASKQPASKPVINERRSSLSGMHPHEVALLRLIVNHGVEHGAEMLEQLKDIAPDSLSDSFKPLFSALYSLPAY